MSWLLGFRRPRLPLHFPVLPVTEPAGIPEELVLPVAAAPGEELELKVEKGSQVSQGEVLVDGAATPATSPVQGEVVAAIPSPRLGGNRTGYLIHIRGGAPEDGPGFEPISGPLDDREALLARLDEAGCSTLGPSPISIRSLLAPEGKTPEVLVVHGIDEDPPLCSQAQLLRDSTDRLLDLFKLLEVLVPKARLVLTLPGDLLKPCQTRLENAGVELKALSPSYPETSASLLPFQLGASEPGARAPKLAVLSMEAALACLRAVRDGEPMCSRVLTVVGLEGKPCKNVRLPLGCPISVALDHCRIKTGDGDAILAGGFMKGDALVSTRTPVDREFAGLTVIPASRLADPAYQPCCNCGSCARVCPMLLQVQLIGRYVEFDLYQEADKLGARHCVECGLCAHVCPANRPLVQWFRLANYELLCMEAAEKAREEAEREAEQEIEQVEEGLVEGS